MVWIITAGSVMCGWAMLTLLGGERERRIAEVEQMAALSPTTPAPSIPSPAGADKSRGK